MPAVPPPVPPWTFEHSVHCAREQRETTVAEGSEMAPMVEIIRDGRVRMVLIGYDRDALPDACYIAARGLAPEALCIVADARIRRYAKDEVTPTDLEHGSLERMQAAGDTAVLDTLMITRMDRDGTFRSRTLPYTIDGTSVVWIEDPDLAIDDTNSPLNFDGWYATALRHAFLEPPSTADPDLVSMLTDYALTVEGRVHMDLLVAREITALARCQAAIIPATAEEEAALQRLGSTL